MNTFAIPDSLCATWRSAMQGILQQTGLDFACITRDSGDGLVVLVAAGDCPEPAHEGSRLPPGSMCTFVHEHGQQVALTDVRANPMWATAPAAIEGIGAYFGRPLCLPSGGRFGTLCLTARQRMEDPRLTEQQLHCLAELIEQHIALLSTNELMRSQLDALPGASFASSPDGRLLFASARCGTLLGLHPADITGTDVNAVLQRLSSLCEEPEATFAMLQCSALQGGPSNGKLHLDDGRTLRWQARRLREEGGSVLGCIWFLEDATAELQARAGLTRREALFRGLFNNASVGIALLDRQGFVVRGNAAFARMMGTSPDHLHGTPIRAVLPGEESESRFGELLALADGETEELHGCWRMVRYDGSRLWVDMHASRLPGEGEEALMLVGVDVTEQRRTESALAESERRYRTLFDNAQAGIFRTSLIDGHFIEANLRMAQMFGYDDVETFKAEYHAAENYVSPADRDRMLEKLRTEGSFATMETHMRRRDGSNTWFLYSGTLDGDTIIGVANEISEMRATQEALQRSEERYRALFDNASDGLLLYEADGTLIDVNDTVCRRLGAPREWLVGKHVKEVVAPEIYEQVAPRLNEILETGSASFESLHRTATGTLSVEVHAQRIEFQGRYVVLSSARDITERKNLEAALLREATTDPLTGIRNRRQFFVDANREFARALRLGAGLAVLMLDIDHFKNINDRHGHHAGDAMLRSFAACCADALRSYDIFGRLGGEEFAVVLPASTPEDGMETAERLRRRISRLSVVYDGTPLHCTVSIGVANLATPDLSFDDMLRRADRALYTAKANGRDRSEAAPQPVTEQPAA